MINKTEIGHRFLSLRKHLRLSQEAFGKTLKVSRVTINQIENGKIFPTLELITKTIVEHKISFEYLILGLKSENTLKIDQSIETIDQKPSGNNKIEALNHKINYLEETIEALKMSNKDKETIIKLLQKK